MHARRWIAVLAAVALSLLGLVAASPSQAHQASTGAPPTKNGIPSAVPSASTPQVDNGAVWSVAQVGNTMVMGGTFTSVGGVTHNYIAAFDATTGAMSSTFNASTNGQVYSVQPGPSPNTVYVGGSFTQVDGQAVNYLTLLDTNTGQIVSSFHTPNFDYGMVRDMVVSGGRLYIGGFFGHVGGQTHSGIAALNATTGAVDSYLNVQLAGHHNSSGSGAQGYIGTWALDASPDGSRLVVVGNFATADGLSRDQLVMIDLNSGSAVVDPNWATNGYTPLCFSWAFDGYVRGVSFSPDGSYFVVNATGGGNPGTLCDATSRFETNATGTNIQPTWVDQTGGDTVWGVTITNDAIYIGGHNRWNNNPLGVDQAQPGAVPRPGLAALDPVSGRPYTWNPGHNPLGAAVYALLATPTGLWMAWDQDWIGNYQYKRQKIAFFPYTGGSTLASTSTAALPGTVYLGNQTANGPTNVLYRVDTGGPQLASLDGGPAWAEDDDASQSPYDNHQSNDASWGPVAHVASTVPATTPSAIFNTERWSPTDIPPMTWTFPVPAGTHVQVRLYFANRYTGTSQVGQRVFNVSINGSQVLNHYDIVADVGDQTGTMKSFNVTSPITGKVTISFTHVTENPLIDGIELINNDIPAPPPPSDTLSAVGFDGTTATTPQPVLGTGIPWGQTRGAFMVGNQLFYGSGTGYLYRTTVSGSTFGTATKVDPYHDPVWDGVDTHDGTTFDGNSPQLYGQLAGVTGMFYDSGRLYFTIAGDPNLHWAWFSPDSGIVDNSEFNATSSVDFSNAGGMFVSGNTLYYVNKTNESLYSVSYSGGTVSGSPQLVNGPGSGGIDWTNKSLFFVASPPANKPPTAAFGSTCTAGGCAFDGSGSSDSDGSIVNYSWDFGDGSSAGTGVTTSHVYSQTGTYTVTLTVTDNGGLTNSVTHQVTINSLNKQISFVGAAHSAAGSSTSKSVTIPSSASIGDTMVLVMTSATSNTWTGPGSGWTQAGTTLTNATIASSVWTRQVAAGDPGSKVTFTSPTNAKAVVSLAVYDGVSDSHPIDVMAGSADAGGTSHTTPSVAATAGDWVASWWTDKSAAVSAWTAPSGVTQRDASYDTGTSGRFSSLVADSGGPVAAGSYGGLTATTDTSSDKAIMWTIALQPGSTNQSPVAAFTSSCDSSGSCSFDGSGSTDPDGTVASYAWDFGDSGSASTQKPNHAYASSGTYTVKLTVTDNGGATNTVSHQVTVTVPAANPIAFVAAAHSAAGSSTSKSVTIPAGAGVGDTLVLVFTSATSNTWTGPGSGWTQAGTAVTSSTITSSVWTKQVAAGDPGKKVTFTSPTSAKAVASLADYAGVSASAPVDVIKGAGDSGGTSHTSPTINASAGDWVASWWTDKSTAVAAWTAPSGVTQRDASYDTGTSGRFSSLLADSGAPVAAGPYGGLVATTDSASDKAVMWTIALAPAH